MTGGNHNSGGEAREEESERSRSSVAILTLCWSSWSTMRTFLGSLPEFKRHSESLRHR